MSRAFLIIALSLALFGCRDNVHDESLRSKMKSSRIENVLLRDSLIAYQINKDAVNRYKRTAELMSEIDLSGTGDDFRAAYIKHIDAWRERGVAEESQMNVDSAEKQVSDTFAAVEKIALSQGAKLPPKELAPSHYTVINELAKKSAQRDEKKESPVWILLGRNDANCDISYKTPLIKIASGFRFWVKFECVDVQSDRLPEINPYKRVNYRFYLSCESEKYWTEFVEYFDESGKNIHSSDITLFGDAKGLGPDMEAAGLAGEIIGEKNLLKKVYETNCI